VPPAALRVVVAHGAGSAPDVATAAFAPADGWAASSFWLAGHGPAKAQDDDGASDRDALAAEVRRVAPDVVAGISYGAHQVARWAAAGVPAGVHGLALVMPAWTGPAGSTAAATAAQADAFASVGIQAELARIVDAYPGWVADALAASWPAHDTDRLVAGRRAVASSAGPTDRELGALAVRTTVVALVGDPLHPADVARHWAAAIPGSRLREVSAHGLADLGRAARAGLG
jgi:hypothetical protein